MDDLRAAVARALALTPATRLIAVDAVGLVDASDLAVYAGFERHGDASPAPGLRTVVADPLRLPLVEGMADFALIQFPARSSPVAQLREVWRVLAPAGIVVLIVPLPRPYSLKRLITGHIARRRIAGFLELAMFAPGEWRATTGAFVVRAAKRDGLAPPTRITQTVQRTVPASVSRARTNTA